MNRLRSTVKDLSRNKRKALVIFLTAGYPSLKATEDMILRCADAGADIIEIGVPFSDPIADGKTIQRSSDKALRAGVRFPEILAMVTRVRKKCDIPLLLMGYMNPFISAGVEKTMTACKKAGVDGFIVPDVIPEESGDFERVVKKHDMVMIPFVAPNTPTSRMKMVDKCAEAFVYVVSVAGVTGVRKSAGTSIISYLKATKRTMQSPRFMGFGISGPAQVKQVKPYVDGVIVGSAIVNIINENKAAPARKKTIEKFVRSLRRALD